MVPESSKHVTQSFLSKVHYPFETLFTVVHVLPLLVQVFDTDGTLAKANWVEVLEQVLSNVAAKAKQSARESVHQSSELAPA